MASGPFTAHSRQDSGEARPCSRSASKTAKYERCGIRCDHPFGELECNRLVSSVDGAVTEDTHLFLRRTISGSPL